MTIEAEAREVMFAYERATRSKDFDNVAPLLHPDAFYRFNDGDHRGLDELRGAFVATWKNIRDEVYEISDVSPIVWNNDLVSVSYVFKWSGIVDGAPAMGSGRGFNTLTRGADGRLKIWNEILTA